MNLASYSPSCNFLCKSQDIILLTPKHDGDNCPLLSEELFVIIHVHAHALCLCWVHGSESVNVSYICTFSCVLPGQSSPCTLSLYESVSSLSSGVLCYPHCSLAFLWSITSVIFDFPRRKEGRGPSRFHHVMLAASIISIYETEWLHN